MPRFDWLKPLRKALGLSRTAVRRKTCRPASRLAPESLEDRTTPALTVVSAAPAPEWVPVPVTSVDLTFNNPVNPASVHTADLALSRGSVTAANVVPGTSDRTVRFTLSGLTATGPVTMSLGAARLTAANGETSDAYSRTYTLTSFGFSPAQPAGGMVYTTPSRAGSTFTFAVDAGQRITLVATPPSGGTTNISVTLRGPGGVTGAGPVLGSATAPAAAAAAILQTTPAPATGLYTATVSGAPVGAAATLKVVLNAAQEVEGTGAGVTNNTPATAQSLSAGFAPLAAAPGSPDRTGVVGLSTGSPDHYAVPLQAGQSMSAALGQVNPNDRLFNAPAVVNSNVGSSPTDVAAGDLDGNGLPDLVQILTSGGTSGLILVHAGSDGANARFTQGASQTTGGNAPRAVRLADVTGDGVLDAIVANEGSSGAGAGVAVLVGTGNNPLVGDGPLPSFGSPVLYPAGARPHALAVGDVDGDDDLDVAVGNAMGSFAHVLLNNGDGTFAAAVPVSLATASGAGAISHGVAIGDVTGDGTPDLVAVTVDNPSLVVVPGVGDGTFANPVGDFAGGSNPRSVVLGDFNGDGRLDAATGLSNSRVGVFLNRGPSNDPFGAAVLTPAPTSNIISINKLTAADFNQDGYLDLAATLFMTSDPVVRVLFGDGGGQFPTRIDYRLTDPAGLPLYAAGGIAAADVNGDKSPDVVTANGGSNNLSVMTNAMSRLRLDVVDAAGEVLIAGVPAANAASAARFVAQDAGTYYLRVSGSGRSEYAVAVVRGAAFDTERNDTPETAQSLDGVGAVAGHIDRPRLFAVTDSFYGGVSRVIEYDPVTGSVLRSFAPPVSISPGAPGGLAFDGSRLFYLSWYQNHVLYELDPTTGVVRDSYVIPGAYNVVEGVAALNGKVYLSDSGGNTLIEFDPAIDAVTRTMSVAADLDGGLAGVTGPDRLVATVNTPGGLVQVVEIDPATGQVTASFPTDIPNFKAGGVAVANGWVYVSRVGSPEPAHLVYDRSGRQLFTWIEANGAVEGLAGDDAVRVEDWYTVTVAAGDTLRLRTATPGDGRAGLGNTLDPMIHLFDPSGQMVGFSDIGPDFRNESLVFTAEVGGLYRVRVVGADGTTGAYVLTAETRSTNTPPDAADDAASTNEEVSVTINVLGNDTDPDGDSLTVRGFTKGAHGSVAVNPGGTITYTPDRDFYGVDTFLYMVSDGWNGTDTVTVTVFVNPVNDAPVARDDAYTTAEDTPLVVAAPGVRGNDSDPDFAPDGTGEWLALEVIDSPTHGGLQLNNDGSFTYTPVDANYHGTDSFTYRVTDSAHVTSTATVTITIAPVNDAPFAGSMRMTWTEDQSGTIDVLAGGSDPDGDTLTVISITQPAHGTALLNADGTVTYTAKPNYHGVDAFTYTVSDGKGGTATGSVTLDIAAVNDAPVAAADAYATDEGAALVVAAPGLLSNDTDVDGDTLTAVLVAGPAHGTLSVNADGSFTYTPHANYNGTDTFTYQAKDASTASPQVTVTLTVRSMNNAPVAGADQYATDEDAALVVAAPGALANDADPEGAALTAALAAGPVNGTVAVAADGSFTYTPDANFHGTDSFTYTVSDGAGGTTTGTVTVTVRAVNDAPTGAADLYATNEDTPLVVDAVKGVLANDADAETARTALTAVLETGPAHGTLTLNADGSFTYTPHANYRGPDSFTYRVSDGTATSAPVTVSLTVAPINDAPMAQTAGLDAVEDGSVTIDLRTLVADLETSDDQLTFTVTRAANGSVALEADGFTARFTPDPNSHRAGSFTYSVRDTGDGVSGPITTGPVTVIVNVAAVNDAPAAQATSLTGAEDSVITVDLRSLVADVETGDDALVFTVGGAAHGSVELVNGHTARFTPAVDYHGPASFTYTVRDTGDGASGPITVGPVAVAVTVTPVNDAPVGADDAADVVEDAAPIAGNVLTNDTDIDAGDTKRVTALAYGTAAGAVGAAVSGAYGALTLGADGQWVYALDNGSAAVQQLRAGQVVTEEFAYTVADGAGAASTAALAVTIAGANDSPVARDDAGGVSEDAAAPATGNVLANDTDADAGDTRAVTQVNGSAAHVGAAVAGLYGTLTLGADGAWRYAVDNASGTVQALTAGATLTDVFTYAVTDGAGATSVAQLSVVITGVNDAPRAAADFAEMDEDADAVVAVLVNDGDVEGDGLVLHGVSAPANGRVTIDAGGTMVKYTPNPDFHGTDTFTYTVSDGHGGTATATVTVTVRPVNDAPVAGAGAVTTAEDTVFTVDLRSLVTDVETPAAGLTFAVGPATNGTAVLLADGYTARFTPASDFHGGGSFQYTVTDGGDGASPALTRSGAVSVAVTAVNDAPTTAADAAATNEDTAVTIAVLPNDTDADGDTLTVTGLTQGAHGTVTLNADGTVRYTPARDYHGPDTFTYTVSDGKGGVATGTVSVTVRPVTDVAIDVIPGSAANEINVKRTATFEVAILSTVDIDARNVDVASVRFGRTGQEDSVTRHKKQGLQYRLADVNADGRADLVVTVDTAKTGLAVGDTRAVLTFRLTGNSTVYTAADSVTIKSTR